MALTDTFVRQVKHSGRPAGDKYTDGAGMYLLVKAAGRYWRQDYAFAGKRKTLALGVYPEVSLAKARQRRDKARELLADGIDPGMAKRAEKLATAVAATNTFEAVAREFHINQSGGWSPRYAARWLERMEKDLFPYVGRLTLTDISAPILLEALCGKLPAMNARISPTRKRAHRFPSFTFLGNVGSSLARRCAVEIAMPIISGKTVIGTSALSGNESKSLRFNISFPCWPLAPLAKWIELAGGNLYRSPKTVPVAARNSKP